jgi:hypothetical protein
MQIEVAVEDLQIDDQHTDWKVVQLPFESSSHLFHVAEVRGRSEGTCIVVGVEYSDGARGSRLFRPKHKFVLWRRVA